MTAAEVEEYQARLAELLEERRRLAGDNYPHGGCRRFMALLAAGTPSRRQQAGL